MNNLFSVNAAKWLQSMGYPAASLATPMDGIVSTWWSYLRAEAEFYTREETDERGAVNRIKVRSCTPADMVCTDLANMLYNEKATVSLTEADDAAQAWLDGWLNRTAWGDRAPLAMKRMCATGTAAWALHVRGASEVGQSESLQVDPIRYDARSIVPLAWDDTGCTECAFVSPLYIDGERCHQVELHRPDDADGNYRIMCSFYDSSGEQIAPVGYLQPDEALDTKQPLPTFQLIRLAEDNPWWDYSPMGVALFASAIDAIETVDLAFDALGNEITLGKKMLLLPESMFSRTEQGVLQVPHMSGQQFFLATESNAYDGQAGVFEYNPSIRATEDRQMLATALQMLGKRVGFGTKAYALDASGNITTAKQVASDNAEIMRTVRKHEHVIEPAVRKLIEAAASVHRTLGTAALPDITGKVQVVLGDSIIEDDDTLRERDRADVAAGLLEPWRYMVRWQGYTEEEARAATQAAAEEPLEL